MTDLTTPDAVRQNVRAKYAEIATGQQTSCCGPACGDATNAVSDVSESYHQIDGYTADADLKLGCGLPTQYAALQPGETVLDLGSGAGLDAFVARREVGASGRVIGVDMTPEMIAKARVNAVKLDYANVEFRLGEIEAMPVEADTIDVAVSNCVLNLVPDKEQAFREMYRVLKPGGRFSVSDIVSTGTLPDAIRQSAELYAGCVAGALPKAEYLALLHQAGFTNVEVAAERTIYLPDEILRSHLSGEDLEALRASEGPLLSVTVTGRKP